MIRSLIHCILYDSNFVFVQVAFQNQVGKFDLEVTTFQMAVLFAWNQRPLEKISFEDLRYVQYMYILFVQY